MRTVIMGRGAIASAVASGLGIRGGNGALADVSAIRGRSSGSSGSGKRSYTEVEKAAIQLGAASSQEIRRGYAYLDDKRYTATTESERVLCAQGEEITSGL